MGVYAMPTMNRVWHIPKAALDTLNQSKPQVAMIAGDVELTEVEAVKRQAERSMRPFRTDDQF